MQDNISNGGVHHPPGSPSNDASVPVITVPNAQHPPSPADPKKVATGSGAPKSGGPSLLVEVLSIIGIVAAAFFIAFLIVAFVFRSYQVDGPSMESTLQNADKLIIWKVPRTWADITGHDYIPKRGDIVVFTEKGLSQFGQEDSKQIIKRVIALPGERVVIKDNHYVVYNSEHPEGFNPDKTLPYGKHIPVTTGVVDTTLKEHQIFVSGDNRPDSLDSRAFGPINADQIVGKLILRVFPISQAQAF